MTTEVSKLTPESPQDAYIVIDDGEPVDLTGAHEGKIFYFERKTSAKGNTYYSVGVEITSGPGKGESVFGRVFKGKKMDEFLRSIGQDPDTPVATLSRDQVVHQRVRITVAAEEQEAVGGGTETRWVIREFAPLA